MKTTMRYHLIQVRTAIIKKSTNNKCWRECGEKGILLTVARNISKNTEMRPNETSKLLHSKENHKQHEKTNYGMGEDICKQCNWQGVNFQNMQWLIQVNNNKNRQPSRKMGRKTK